MSDLCVVESEVPQGCILDPLLFIVYINDLFYYFPPEKGICYLDDTSLLNVVNSFHSWTLGMSHVVDKTETGFTQNNLILNVNKTQQIMFSTKPDNELVWTAHI